jgi:transposase
MIGSTRQIRVLAFNQPTDMRKGYDSLSAIVTYVMNRNPLDGDMYLFVARNRKRAKVLFWNGTGLCILSKRLEKGRFVAPWKTSPEHPMRLTMSELQLLLEGSKYVGAVPLSPSPFSFVTPAAQP